MLSFLIYEHQFSIRDLLLFTHRQTHDGVYYVSHYKSTKMGQKDSSTPNYYDSTLNKREELT